jgi:hypothetical protein
MLEFNNSSLPSKRDSLERVVGGGGAGVGVMGSHMELHKRRVGRPHWCPMHCYYPAAHTKKKKKMEAHLATPFCSIPCRRRRYRDGGDPVSRVCHGSRKPQSDHHGQLLQSRAAKGSWKQALSSTGLRSCRCTIQRGNHFGPEERHLVCKSRCVPSCLARVSPCSNLWTIDRIVILIITGIWMLLQMRQRLIVSSMYLCQCVDMRFTGN